jgi:hypothetical protein
MFETSVTQAWLLQSVFGLFCGSRMLYHHAEISRGGSSRRPGGCIFFDQVCRLSKSSDGEERRLLRKSFGGHAPRTRSGDAWDGAST